MPLSLVKRIPLGRPITPVEEDTNKTNIENAVNGQEATLATSLNPDGTLKNNTVSTAAIVDRAVTQAKLAFNSAFYAVDTGGVNALAVAFVPPCSALVAGMVLYVKVTSTNTGSSSLAVDAQPATPIRKITTAGIVPLTGGELHAGCVAVFVFDGTVFQLVAKIDSDAVPGASRFAVFAEQQPANTNGGDFNAGSWALRGLNTVVYDPNGIGSIVANKVRLQSGIYRYEAEATCFRVLQSRLRLYNYTAPGEVAGSYSLSGHEQIGSDNANIIDRSVGEFELTVQSDIGIEHRCSSSYAGSGRGVAANIDGKPEQYSRIALWKLV